MEKAYISKIYYKVIIITKEKEEEGKKKINMHILFVHSSLVDENKSAKIKAK